MNEGRARLQALLSQPALAALLSLLDGEGEEARVVGGAVRDALLGERVNDVDVTTTATPDIVAERARRMGWRTIPTGIEHGTLTVLIEGVTCEVTTLREDIETDGRKAVVRFGRDFRADALRRDFTINALSADRRGGVFDYAGGLDDLAARRVRFIGEAAQRIREDYLRILRFFRFHARFGEGPLDRDGMAAAIAHREGLAGLSRERVRAEMMKLLVAPGAAATLAEIDGAGFLLAVTGGVCRTGRFALLRGGELADPVVGLAALCVASREDAARLRKLLRLSNEETTRLEGAAGALERTHGGPPPTRDEVRALLFAHGRPASVAGLTIAGLDAPATARAGFALAARMARTEDIPVAPFGGDDLLDRGLSRGRALGLALKQLQADWIRAGFPTDPAHLARLLDAVADPGRRGG